MGCAIFISISEKSGSWVYALGTPFTAALQSESWYPDNPNDSSKTVKDGKSIILQQCRGEKVFPLAIGVSRSFICIQYFALGKTVIVPLRIYDTPNAESITNES